MVISHLTASCHFRELAVIFCRDSGVERCAVFATIVMLAAEITEGNNLIFSGALFSKGAFAEVGADINPLLPGGDHRLADTEGITMRVKSEGHTYACVLRTGMCDMSGLMHVTNCICRL